MLSAARLLSARRARPLCAMAAPAIARAGGARVDAGVSLAALAALAAAASASLTRSASCEEGVLLEGRGDPYGGITVDCGDVESSDDAFGASLDASLEHWRRSGTRGVWLKVPLSSSRYVPIAAARGFEFHSAEKDHCLMNLWLPDTPSPLPPNASHQVGVGSIIVNAKNQVLLVQEAVGPTAGKNIWKIPTGLVNAREDLGSAAVRETLEETGLACDFRKVLAFRHSHYAPNGKSDLFFTVLLQPKDDDAALTLQASEIAKAKWANFDDFLKQTPYPANMPIWTLLYTTSVGQGGIVGDVPGFKREHFPSQREGSTATVYLNGDAPVAVPVAPRP